MSANHMHIKSSFMLSKGLNQLFNKEALIGYLFILPSLIGFAIFFAYPAVRAVYISFLDWNLLTDAKYVGLENYQTLIDDKRFWDSLRVTALYVLWNIPLQTVLAVFMAVMLERFSTMISSIMRGIMILPWLMPNVVVALLWLWILDPSIGLMNEFLKAVGISRQPFMGSPDQAIQSIAGINIWRHVGYTSILVFAGLKTIPKSLYEAAASSTRVIIYYIYQQVFERRINMGMATAASVVLFSILITVTIVQMRLLRSGESDLADYQ